jgi:hypothetical protein
MDNGYLKLTHVRIPRENMAMRYVRVEQDGRFVKIPGAHPKAAYISMMQVGAGAGAVFSRWTWSGPLLINGGHMLCRFALTSSCTLPGSSARVNSGS